MFCVIIFLISLKEWDVQMKKIVLLLTFCFCFTCITIGCQNKEHLLDQDNPTAITIWHYYNGAQQEAFDTLIEEFNDTVGKEKGIIVEGASQGTVNDLETNVLAAINGKAGAEPLPNIFAAYGDTAYQVDQLGYALDLSKYFSDAQLKRYIDNYVEEGRFSKDGGLKIFPIAKSVEILMLNKTDWDKFARETGVQLDTLSTIEGVCQIAQQYYDWTDAKTEIPNDGKAFFGRDAMANYMIIGYRQLADEIFAVKDGDVTFHFERDVVKKLWDYYYIPYIKGYFSSSGRFRSDDIKTGNIICCVGSSSSATYFPNEVILNDEESYPIDIETFVCPKFQDGKDFAVQQGAGMVVTKADEKTELASVEFLKWFTEDEQNIRFSISSGYLPVTKSANDFSLITESVVVKENMKQVLSSSLKMTNGNTMYTTKAFERGTDARAVLENSMQDLAVQDRELVVANLNRGMTLEEAVRQFSSDDYFDQWFQDVKAELELLAG